MKKKKNNWLKKSIRIVGMHPQSYEESWRVKMNNLQLVSVLLLFIIFFIFLSYLFYAYTPLGYLLPENIKNRNKQKIEMAMSKATRLEQKVIIQDKYIQNLQNVILGKLPVDSIFNEENATSLQNIEIEIDTTISDVEIQLDEKLKSEEIQKTNVNNVLGNLFFFDPIEGEVSQRFRLPNHIGVDIVPKNKNEQIKSCLEGTVIYSSFTNADGYVIIIAHKNEIISVYKHAKSVYVKTGDNIKIGEIIGVVGNTGERSSGTHLHFEIWNEGQPLNPLNYFSFGK